MVKKEKQVTIVAPEVKKVEVPIKAPTPAPQVEVVAVPSVPVKKERVKKIRTPEQIEADKARMAKVREYKKKKEGSS